MSNTQKRHLFSSKRQVRRIIKNETDIEIAGSSTDILQQSLTDAINVCSKDYDLHSHKNYYENIYASIENINNIEVLSEVTFCDDENHQQCLTNNNTDI